MSRAAAITALLAVASPALAAEGTLTTVTGEVYVTPAGGKEAPAQKGQAIDPGAKIRTGAKGSADITLENGSVVSVQPSTSMSFSGNKRQKKKNSVVLFFGRVWSKVTGGSNYEVTTPNAVCGVRGTQFVTTVADDGSVKVQVTEGKVAVDGEGDDDEDVSAGQEVEADEEGVDEAGAAEEAAKLAAWEQRKRERLAKGPKKIVEHIKGRIQSKKEKIERLRAEQKAAEAKRKEAEARAQRGESGAVQEIRELNQKLAETADEIADLGDEAESQFGIVDHFADLAGDPRFKMVDRKYLEMEAKSLRRVKASLDALVKEGTDISIEAMDKMLKDMGSGKPGSIRDDSGSAADDLFGKEQDMR